MGSVIYDISVSLDGFVTGPHDGADAPLGAGGDALHDWLCADAADADRAVLAELFTAGAVIAGRRTFDFSDGPGGWGAGPLGTTPVFVLTHRPVQRDDGAAEFTFVGDPADAVAKAKATAGESDVYVMSAGAAASVLRLGLLDAVRLHVVPVVLGGGVPVFAGPLPAGVSLAAERTVQTAAATHLWYRVLG